MFNQDRIKGHPMSVDAMVKIAEAMVIALKLKSQEEQEVLFCLCEYFKLVSEIMQCFF